MSVFLARGRLPHILAWSLGLLLLLWFWPHTSALRYGLILLLLGGDAGSRPWQLQRQSSKSRCFSAIALAVLAMFRRETMPKKAPESPAMR